MISSANVCGSWIFLFLVESTRFYTCTTEPTLHHWVTDGCCCWQERQRRAERSNNIHIIVNIKQYNQDTHSNCMVDIKVNREKKGGTEETVKLHSFLFHPRFQKFSILMPRKKEAKLTCFPSTEKRGYLQRKGCILFLPLLSPLPFLFSPSPSSSRRAEVNTSQFLFQKAERPRADSNFSTVTKGRAVTSSSYVELKQVLCSCKIPEEQHWQTWH